MFFEISKPGLSPRPHLFVQGCKRFQQRSLVKWPPNQVKWCEMMSYVFHRLCDVENDKTIKLCEFLGSLKRYYLEHSRTITKIDSFEEKTRIRAPGAPGHVIPILMATRILGFNPFQSLVSVGIRWSQNWPDEPPISWWCIPPVDGQFGDGLLLLY